MTNTVINNVTAHYKAKLAGQLLSMEVEEWNTTIYYRTTSSLRAESHIMNYTQQGKTAEALVETIIQKSLDSEGKKLFKETDRATLLNEADPKVLIKVAAKLNSASDETIADIEGN